MIEFVLKLLFGDEKFEPEDDLIARDLNACLREEKDNGA